MSNNLDYAQSMTDGGAATPSSWYDSLTDIEEGPRASSGLAPTRRGFIQGTTALMGALAFGLFDTVLRIAPSSAAVGSEYTSCANYDWWSGYHPNTTQKVCVGGTYSYQYCGSDGWFKNGRVDSYNRYVPIRACGHRLTKRNAWRWRYGNAVYRCADGYWYWTPPYSPNAEYRYFRICSKWLYATSGPR